MRSRCSKVGITAQVGYSETQVEECIEWANYPDPKQTPSGRNVPLPQSFAVKVEDSRNVLSVIEISVISNQVQISRGLQDIWYGMPRVHSGTNRRRVIVRVKDATFR
jgi:hypothetical protein